MRFGEPFWLWMLWLAPALLVFGIWAWRRADRDLARFCDPSLWPRLFPDRSTSARRWKLGVLGAAMLFLLVMAARPQIGSRILSVKRQGIDLLVALDVSESMLAEDLKPNRITRARQEIQTLIDRLRGDRVGLIAFAGEAFAQCPLTLDYGAARMFLRYLDTDLIPVPGTAIAQAIELATRTFDPKQAKWKALVLITDGEDHEGQLREAAEKAREAGVRIFAVGIGTDKGEPIPVRDARGALVDYKRDRSGEVVMTRCDAGSLEEICRLTGGHYYNGNAGELALDQLYDEISKMDQKDMKGGIVTQYEDRYGYFAGAALLLLCLEWMIGERRRNTRSRLARVALWLLAFGGGAALVGTARADAGATAFQKGEWDKARDAYERYVAEHPEDPKGIYNLGTALHKTNELQPAMRALQQALASPDPKLRARAWFNLGNTQAKGGDLEAARDSYRMALRQDSKDRDAKLNLELIDRLLEQAQSDSSQQQKQQQQQQSDDSKQDENQEKNQDEKPEDQASDSKQDGEQSQEPKDGSEQSEEQQQQQQQQEQKEQQQQQPSSSENEDAPTDSTGAASAGEPIKIPPEEARRLLEALQQQEQLLQAERMKAKVRVRQVEKDW